MKDALRSLLDLRSINEEGGEAGHNVNIYYVYILRSETNSSRYYYGSTTDIKKRLKAHNNGQSLHTKKHKPWRVAWFAVFGDKEKAENFEKYLKTASGKLLAANVCYSSRPLALSKGTFGYSEGLF